MLAQHNDRKEFMKQNKEYRKFLKKSLEFFRHDSIQKVDAMSMKMPSIINQMEQNTEK
jgi:hypothetical protein